MCSISGGMSSGGSLATPAPGGNAAASGNSSSAPASSFTGFGAMQGTSK